MPLYPQPNSAKPYTCFPNRTPKAVAWKATPTFPIVGAKLSKGNVAFLDSIFIRTPRDKPEYNCTTGV